MFKKEKYIMYSSGIISDGPFRKYLSGNASSFRMHVIVSANFRFISSQGQDFLYNLDLFPKHLHISVSPSSNKEKRTAECPLLN